MKRLLLALAVALTACTGPNIARLDTDTVKIVVESRGTVAIGSSAPILEPIPAGCVRKPTFDGPDRALSCQTPGTFVVRSAGQVTAIPHDGYVPQGTPATK